MRRNALAAGLFGVAFVVATCWATVPVGAVTVGSGYEEASVPDLLGAAAHLELEGVAEIQQTGVWVMHFLLGVTGGFEPDCTEGLGASVDPFGPHRFESVWSDSDIGILDEVAARYCTTREQAQVLGATLLTFLAGLDAGLKGKELLRPAVPVVADIVPVVVEGSGRATVAVGGIPADFRIVAVEHDGRNVFRMRGLDTAGSVNQLLAEGTGVYTGRRFVESPEVIDAVLVEADGAWKVTFLPVTEATLFDGVETVAGGTDDVLSVRMVIGGEDRVAAFRHEGSGTYALNILGADGGEVNSSTTGRGDDAAYVELAGSARLVEVAADGPWRLEAVADTSGATALTARRGSDGIRLDWLPPNSVPDAVTVSYLVEHSLDAGRTWSEATVNGTVAIGADAVAVTVMEPSGEVEPSYRVTATHSDGTRVSTRPVMPDSPCGTSHGMIGDLRSLALEQRRGGADYVGADEGRVPKATAVLLIAEAGCVARFPGHDRSVMDELGAELLRWPTEYPSDRYGWGLPFGWDAFGDGTKNPANTVYSISTGLAVKALLDWARVGGEDVWPLVRSSVARALDEWTTPEALTATGQFAYSLSGYDGGYDVFNSSALLAGQMQRAAQLEIGQPARYRSLADTVMQSLADWHLEGSRDAEVILRRGENLDAVADRFGLTAEAVRVANGLSPLEEVGAGDRLLMPDVVASGWYWNYSATEAVPNDLAHAGYVVDGVATYVAEGGALAGLFPMDRVVGHLETFLTGGTTEESMLAWPIWRSPDLVVSAWRAPRLYDIGWALAVVADWPDELSGLSDAACAEVLRYQRDGNEFLKYPRDLDLGGSENPEIHEYVAYLYLGLTRTTCAFNREANTVNQPGDNFQRVPLTSLGSGAGAVSDLWVETGTGRSRLQVAGGTLEVPVPGVPVALAGGDASYVALVRQIPQSTLAFVRWGAGASTEVVPISGQASTAYIPRAMHRDGDSLYLVVYDNVAGQNLLRHYTWESLGLLREWVLPSLEPEAGGTYEMEPPIDFVAGNDGVLRFVGGSLHGTIDGDKVEFGRLVDCSTALEATAGPGAQLLVLCEADDYVVEAWYVRRGGFSLSVVDGGLYSSQRVEATGIPYDLRFNPRLETVEWLDSADTGAAAFLRYEIEHGSNAGVADLGTNNREGRVAWSQIYHLQALLDLVRAGSTWNLSAEVAELVAPATERLRIEMELLETVVRAEGMESMAFTVDRSPALFAVQTSRLASLYQDYLELFPAGQAGFPAIEAVSQASSNLTEHLEVVDESGVDGWLAVGQAHLMWPLGSAFPFDGLNVPFNHQNEWARATIETSYTEVSPVGRQIAEDVLGFFYDQILLPQEGAFPPEGVWPYWWGQAWEGWEEGTDTSRNTPSYPGDRGNAWITFRTIDAEAMVAWSRYLDEEAAQKLLESTAAMVRDGVILPQVAATLVEHGVLPELSDSAFGLSGRASNPSRLPAMVWAHILPRRGAA